VRHRRRLKAIQLRLRHRLRIAQRGQPLPRHLRIEEVLVGADDGAVVGRGLAGLWSCVS
jgi:hypothetical protein